MEAARNASRPTVVLTAVLATAGLLLLLLPLSPALARRFLEQQQLQPSSTASWLAVALLPKMYGGRHEVWLSPEPMTDYLRDHPERAPFDLVHQWVNHYPARHVRVDTARAALAEYGAPSYVRIESRYRSVTLITSYALRVVDGRLRVRRVP